MTQLPDYVRFELDRHLAGRLNDRPLLKLGARHQLDLTGKTAPDDALEAAAHLYPVADDQPVFRGAVEFTISVVMLDRVNRRKCRVVYAATLYDESGKRTLSSLRSRTQVLVWDDNDQRFTWQDFPEDMLPDDAMIGMIDLVEADAVAQEEAGKKSHT